MIIQPQSPTKAGGLKISIDMPNETGRQHLAKDSASFHLIEAAASSYTRDRDLSSKTTSSGGPAQRLSGVIAKREPVAPFAPDDGDLNQDTLFITIICMATTILVLSLVTLASYTVLRRKTRTSFKTNGARIHNFVRPSTLEVLPQLRMPITFTMLTSSRPALPVFKYISAKPSKPLEFRHHCRVSPCLACAVLGPPQLLRPFSQEPMFTSNAKSLSGTKPIRTTDSFSADKSLVALNDTATKVDPMRGMAYSSMHIKGGDEENDAAFSPADTLVNPHAGSTTVTSSRFSSTSPYTWSSSPDLARRNGSGFHSLYSAALQPYLGVNNPYDDFSLDTPPRLLASNALGFSDNAPFRQSIGRASYTFSIKDEAYKDISPFIVTGSQTNLDYCQAPSQPGSSRQRIHEGTLIGLPSSYSKGRLPQSRENYESSPEESPALERESSKEFTLDARWDYSLRPVSREISRNALGFFTHDSQDIVDAYVQRPWSVYPTGVEALSPSNNWEY